MIARIKLSCTKSWDMSLHCFQLFCDEVCPKVALENHEYYDALNTLFGSKVQDVLIEIA